MSGETMLERAGYAVLVADTARTSATDRVRSSMWANSKEIYIELAKAALLAIREPSRDLIDTMDEHALQPSEWIWEAAIDEILNEPPSPSVTHQTGDKP